MIVGIAIADIRVVLAGVAFAVMSGGVFLFGIQQVGPQEIGLILLFGKPVRQIGPGFAWVIFPWSLMRHSALTIEEQYPQDEPNGDRAPIFVTHGKGSLGESEPLDNQLTTTVSIVCRYKVVDFAQFLTTIGDSSQLRRQVRDVVVTTTQVECAKEPVGRNLMRLPDINSALTKAVEVHTRSWGIQVVSVTLQSIDLGGAINTALTNVPISIINKEINRNNAQKIYFEGVAQADVHKAFQFAKAEGYKTIARELNIPEAVVVYQIDTLANMWRRNNADVSLIGGDMAEVFKMVTAFAKLTAAGDRSQLPPAP